MARIEFEELRDLWQSQCPPEPSAVDARGLTDALKRFGRRQNLIFSLKAAVVVWYVWFCFSKLGMSILTVSGEALFLGGAACFLVTDWRHQLDIARLDFTKPSAGFVDSALRRLRDPNAPLRHWFWLYMLCLGAGANLLLAGRWAVSTVQERWLSHATATAAPFACWLVAATIRSKRYQLEYRPLVERLQAMKRAMEEPSQ